MTVVGRRGPPQWPPTAFCFTICPPRSPPRPHPVPTPSRGSLHRLVRVQMQSSRADNGPQDILLDPRPDHNRLAGGMVPVGSSSRTTGSGRRRFSRCPNTRNFRVLHTTGRTAAAQRLTGKNPPYLGNFLPCRSRHGGRDGGGRDGGLARVGGVEPLYGDGRRRPSFGRSPLVGCVRAVSPRLG